MNHRTLLLEDIHPHACELFQSAHIPVDHLPHALTEKELITVLPQYTIVGVRSVTQVSATLIRDSPQLSVIGTYGIGVSHIDLAACTDNHIAVFNAPYANARSVVELAVGNIIALFRKTFVHSNAMHSGNWQKNSLGSHQIQGKILGIIGYGGIGAQLSQMAEALGMQICFYDLAERTPIGNAKRCLSLPELLSSSDIVSLHVDGRGPNQHLIGMTELMQMKPGSYIMNLSRGHIIDEHALAQVLKSGHLAGAALDVFSQEPYKNGPGFASPLQQLSNVILTPHIGAATQEAQLAIAEYVTNAILKYIHTNDSSHSLTHIRPASQA